MSTYYMSRARLRSTRGEALSAIAPLLLPDDLRHRAGHAHRILWLLFQDEPDTTRDFLWRDDGEGRFYLLSRRPPTDPKGLFDLATKPFEPALEPSDKLRFVLRANPVMASKAALTSDARAKRARGKRVDVVMHALRNIEKTDWEARTGRAFAREEVAQRAGGEWLARQGERAGFRALQELTVSNYQQIAVERRRSRPAGFSMIDFAGHIEVTDPDLFVEKLIAGFGSAKAFGCGLMLIRRA